jgi:hypothetical protein
VALVVEAVAAVVAHRVRAAGAEGREAEWAGASEVSLKPLLT